MINRTYNGTLKLLGGIISASIRYEKGEDISETEYLRRGVVMSLIWSLFEALKKSVDKTKSIEAVQVAILEELADKYRGQEDDLENLKVGAWDRLHELYQAPDGLRDDGEANIINMVEELYFQNIDWMMQIDIELDRHMNWIIYNLTPSDDALPVQSRVIAEQFTEMMNKEIFEYLKNKKRGE